MSKEYRQIIADKYITSSKLFNDFLYGGLALHANEQREIEKGSFVLSKVCDELGMNRKTLAKYFKYLCDSGLVEERPDKGVLKDLGDTGFGIENDILERLVELKKRYALSVYVYLVKGYGVANKKKMVVLLRNVKEFIGIGIGGDTNNYLVTDCFEEFREMGLLNCQLGYDKESGKRFYCLDGVGRNNYF